MNATCSADGCERPRRGCQPICSMHCQRLTKTGRLDRPKDRKPVVDGEVAHVPLTQGLVTVIDLADLHIVEPFLWSVCTSSETDALPYAFSRSGGGLLHRVLLAAGTDDFVDHINHDTLDNRRSNLRLTDNQGNLRNLTLRSTSKSGYIGVSWRPTRDRWRAYVGIDGRLHHVGHFFTAEDAARARDDYIRTNAPSEFWSYNFPLPGEQAARPTMRETA